MTGLPRRGRAARAGFTLLELLVVLALVALTAGMVVPSAVRGLEAARERGARNELRAVLASLPLRAFQSGTSLELDERALRAQLADWPDSLQTRLVKPLRYAPNGMAEGGELLLLRDGQILMRLSIEPVSGRVLEKGLP